MNARRFVPWSLALLGLLGGCRIALPDALPDVLRGDAALEAAADIPTDMTITPMDVPLAMDTMDAPPPDVADDLPVDLPVEPAVDVPVVEVGEDVGPGCGTYNAACCAADAGAMACASGLACLGEVCLACPGTLASCGGSCVDLTSSPTHCGRCSNPCPEGQSCASGTCRLECASGLQVCGGRCVQTSTDVSHCGTCGSACAVPHASPACEGGVCRRGRCEDGWGDCDSDMGNGCETQLDAAPNCGACRVTCGGLANVSASRCRMGACEVVSCRTGFADCDTDAANGCEVNTDTNSASCGMCGRRCTGGGACSLGVCGTASITCDPGLANCDGMTTNGCEVTLTTDARNCGACGNACSLPNATPRCAMSACQVGTCLAGFGNCDGINANGCEADLRVSTARCGACSNVCSLPHAVAACTTGACAVSRCDTGWADCDRDPANGCEVDTTSTVNNCGTCGTTCATANGRPACVASRCAVGVCNDGFANCDGNVTNGCETNTNTAANSCGACGTVCAFANAATTCVAGRCVLGACATGFGNCDGLAVNGCETDLRVAPLRCGSCTNACAMANGVPACATSVCVAGACNPGFGNCDGTLSNGCETSLNTSTANCGACGRVCPSGQACSLGVCASICGMGLTSCSGACVDRSTNPTHCGACGVTCPAPPNAVAECAGSACRFRCAPGFGNCDGTATNGCELDLRADVRNCGSCAAACPSFANGSAACAVGACGFTCAAPFASCDGVAANGCEANTSTTVTHCGICGRACTGANATMACTAGACAIASCAAGFGNCNAIVGDGCEANLGTSRTDCGVCGRACPTLATCVSGVCTCFTGFTLCSGACVNLNQNASNCGACGTRCATGQVCRMGACTVG